MKNELSNNIVSEGFLVSYIWVISNYFYIPVFYLLGIISERIGMPGIFILAIVIAAGIPVHLQEKKFRKYKDLYKSMDVRLRLLFWLIKGCGMAVMIIIVIVSWPR